MVILFPASFEFEKDKKKQLVVLARNWKAQNPFPEVSPVVESMQIGTKR